jgi:hypothetical protein
MPSVVRWRGYVGLHPPGILPKQFHREKQYNQEILQENQEQIYQEEGHPEREDLKARERKDLAQEDEEEGGDLDRMSLRGVFDD